MNYKGSNKFGVLPRRTVIANQPHMLAYINPQEEMLLRQLGGAGEPVGPMEIPAYYFGMGGQEQPSENFGYDAPGDRGGGGNQGVSANDYNAAISRVNQPFERGYNQNSRNRDLATIDAYNASFTPVNDPSEIATPTISSPVSDDSFLSVSDGGSGYVDYGTDGVGTSSGEVTVDPTNTSGATTTSIVGTSMFDNMRNLMAQEEAKNNIGSSGYVSVDAMADTTPDVGFVPDNYTPDLGGYIGAIDDDGLPNVDVNESDFIDDPYAIDIQDTNIYTENPDGTYTVEDGEPDPIDVFDPDEYIDSSGNGDGGGTATTTTNTATQRTDPYEYFNLYRSTAPSSWLRNSIYNAYGTGPDFDVDVYQAADGSLRFTETDQLVPEEYLKYIPYARRTEMDAPVEEES